MDFSLSDEQSLLKDSIERFVTNDYDFDSRRKIMAADEGFSREIWKQFAELGWLAVPFDEDDGGFGGGPIEMMLVMEQIGRGLIVEPYLPTVVLAGGFLRHAGSAEQKEKYLSGIIDGSKMAAFAFG